MNVRAILSLAWLGAAMGVASSLGWTGRAEPWLWSAIALVCAVALSRAAPGRFFHHGFLTGALAGAASPIFQALLFPLYLANNPRIAADVATIPGAVPPRLFYVLLALPLGLAFGLVLGLLTWLAARARRRPAAP